MTADELKAIPSLNQRNSDLRRILDALSAAVLITDAEGRLVYFNPAAEKLSGHKPELGRDQWCITWKMFLPDGTPLTHAKCVMAVALSGGEVTTGVEYIAERPDGSRFWFTPYPSVLRDEEGKITGGINLLVDITPRKIAQLEEEGAARLLSAIVDSSDDAIISKNLDGVITSWNKSAQRLFGYTAEEVVGKPVTVLIPSDRLNEEPAILARLRKGERVDHFETKRRKKDASLLDISLTISPVKDSQGRVIGASKVARDITGTKRAEQNSRLLAAIVDSSDDAIISKTLDGIITSWNESAQRLFGYTAEEIVGKPVTMLIPSDRLSEEPEILARLRKASGSTILRPYAGGRTAHYSIFLSPFLPSGTVRDGLSAHPRLPATSPSKNASKASFAAPTRIWSGSLFP